MCDLVGRQAAEQAQRQRHARFGRQHRVASDEHQAQHVVADVVFSNSNFVLDRLELRPREVLLDLQLTTEQLLLLREPHAAANEVDGAVFGRGHEPSARLIRDARLGPLL